MATFRNSSYYEFIIYVTFMSSILTLDRNDDVLEIQDFQWISDTWNKRINRHHKISIYTTNTVNRFTNHVSFYSHLSLILKKESRTIDIVNYDI